MLKAHQEPCEHRFGGVAQIIAELELAEVLRKMLPANMDMRASDGSLEHGPETFNGIDVVNTINPLIGRMVDGAVVVTEARDFGIGRKFIRADGRAALDVGQDVPLQGLALHVRDDSRHDITAALDHAKDNRLTWCATPALAAGSPPADVGFIGLDMPAKRRIAINGRHVLADLVRHAPRRLVGHAQLALKLFRWNAMPGSGEQVHGVEPLREWGVCPRKGRAFHGADLVAAPLAAIDGALAQAMKLALNAAAWAIQRFAVADLHKVIQATIVVREPLEKLVNRRCLGHARVLLPINMGRVTT